MYFCLLPKCHWASSFIWHKNKDSLITSARMTLNYPRNSQKCKASFIVWHHFDQNCSLKFCNTQVIIVSHMPGGIWLIRGFCVKQKTYNQNHRALRKLGLKRWKEDSWFSTGKHIFHVLQWISIDGGLITAVVKHIYMSKWQLSILKINLDNQCKLGMLRLEVFSWMWKLREWNMAY